MDINDKKLKRTSKIINWTIAIVLGIFLILFSNLLIGDLDSAVERPDYYDYVSRQAVDKFDMDIRHLETRQSALYEVKANYLKMEDAANAGKAAEQESFDNWVKTRTSVGSPEQDKEVLQRTRKMDEYRDIAAQWRAKSDSVQSLSDSLQSEIYKISEEKDIMHKDADREYNKALNVYELRVFLVRLLFVAPVLALGVFFFIRYRNHRFAALFMGFTLFSVYAFFFGLLPYLPSYGGYIRYAVGILLTLGLGYYAIRRLKNYSDRKKAELKESTAERARKLQNEIVEKAFNNHICPSCGKDFLLRPWEAPEYLKERTAQSVSAYCRFCGLQLIKECKECGQHNYAHLPYCISCGAKIKED